MGEAVVMEGGLSAETVDRRAAEFQVAGERAQRAVAFYAREVEARRLFVALGYSSAVLWAVERLRVGRSRAYELLMVGRKLEELPALDRAFASGRLSWSVVRRVARVAVPETVGRWIEECEGKRIDDRVEART